MSRTNNIFVTPVLGTGGNHRDGDNINLLVSDQPLRPGTVWIMSELSQLPDHGSLLDRGSHL